MNKFRVAIQTSVFVILVLATCTLVQAQATRTWVSGVGDDVNPCSRTAPCKTFAGAISKTATNGEINCLDPAGYGAVTVTKSITIDCEDTQGSILSAGTTGVIINMAAGDAKKAFRLRGVSINGAGTGTFGIRVLTNLQYPYAAGSRYRWRYPARYLGRNERGQPEGPYRQYDDPQQRRSCDQLVHHRQCDHELMRSPTRN